jgi:hypothetical protein
MRKNNVSKCEKDKKKKGQLMVTFYDLERLRVVCLLLGWDGSSYGGAKLGSLMFNDNLFSCV